MINVILGGLCGYNFGNSTSNKYLPFVRINNISFDRGLNPQDNDSPILSITINYDVPRLNLNSSLVLDKGNIN